MNVMKKSILSAVTLGAIVVAPIAFSESQAPDSKVVNTTEEQLDRGDGKMADVNYKQEFNVLGKKVYVGSVDGDPNSDVVKVENNNNVSMTNVVSKYGEYHIIPKNKKMARIRGSIVDKKIDGGGVDDDFVKPVNNNLQESKAPLTAAYATTSAQVSSAATQALNSLNFHPVKLDVLWGYTNNAMNDAGGKTNMETLMALNAVSMNVALQKSGANIYLNPVAFVKTNTGESGSYSTTLDRLRNPSDGYFDDLSKARETYKADFVQLYSSESSPTECGLGYIGNSEDTAFSVVGKGCVASYVVALHELGHNFGLNHDHYTTNTMNSTAYNYGYVNTTYKFNTIMSYNNQCADMGFTCRTIPMFSNPLKKYNGTPMGIAAGKPNASDSVRYINEHAVQMSNYRVSNNSNLTRVNNVTPANDEDGVDVNKVPIIFFNSPVKNINSSNANIVNVLTGAKTPVARFYNANNNSLVMKPIKALDRDTQYKIVLNDTIASAVSGRSISEFDSDFITGARPNVSSTNVKSYATNVDRNIRFNINFTEKVKWGDTDTNIKLYDGNNQLVDTNSILNYNDFTTYTTKGYGSLTLAPNSELKANSRYTVKVPSPMTDMAGNHIRYREYTFTTGR